MINSTEPNIHRQRQQVVMAHIEQVLADDRLRIDTRHGTRLARGLKQRLVRGDASDELARLMSQSGGGDGQQSNQMPQGLRLEAQFIQQRLGILKEIIARLQVICVSPTRQLLRNEPIEPINTRALHQVLESAAPASAKMPVTLIIVSTSGFTVESHELVDRRADRILILMQPNDAGGWDIYAPAELTALALLLDPEDEPAKRQRIARAIREDEPELASSGITADKIAGKTHLPVQLIEVELKSYARSAGLVARRLDGRMAVYHQGTIPPALREAQGVDISRVDRIKAIFSCPGQEDKKLDCLEDQRLAIVRYRDAALEQVNTATKQEVMLKRQFREAAGEITKKRVTQQLLQMRHDVQNFQQQIEQLNRQLEILEAHRRNLELARQKQSAGLSSPDQLDEAQMVADAVVAEEMLIRLEAAGGQNESTSPAAVIHMNAQEQALYDQLQHEADTGTAIANSNDVPAS